MALASRMGTARVFGRVLLPTLAKGVIVRRPGVLALEQRVQADEAAIRTVAALRAEHGPGPVRLRVPGRSVALVVSVEDVVRLLDGTPEPFAPATFEKRAALRHFQPHGSLATRGPERAERRRFNEEALRPGNADWERVVRDEVDLLVRHARSTGVLTWDAFSQAWWRVARRIVFGSGARGDEELTAELGALRSAANWAYLRPRREGLRRRFEERVRGHAERGEAGGLAHGRAVEDVVEQAPHWLFAFDAAGIVAMRALAVGAAGDEPGSVSVLESARLWPTTPVILRESTRETDWHGEALPAGTTFVVFTPYFHRAHGDSYRPDLWPQGAPGVVPFSGGPAVCPGRDLVLASAGLAVEVLREQLVFRKRLREPLPATLDHFALALEVDTPEDARPRARAGRGD
ncbi:cytochrome [Actinosynnema pretiosum]|uniref:Cytochrome n=1 Tax=Actinosynnema pretiosum TaxID=42197 RepID=A0A290Z3P4_9PSEU|nr:cytochrome [Actinosynnema pretiosum]ATE53589.1 cytochrome [Actinosynnema pretiosum]